MHDGAATQITALRKYGSAVARYFNALAKRLSMNATDLTALAHLMDSHRTGHVLSPGELGELLSLSGPATTSVVDRLQQQGWVERRRNSSDGRRLELHLPESVETRDGKTVLAGVAALMQDVCSAHTPEEVAAFTMILEELTARFDYAVKHAADPATERFWAPTAEQRVS